MVHRDDSFAQPWVNPEAIPMICGAQGPVTLYDWTPLMSTSFRVIRPALRGHAR